MKDAHANWWKRYGGKSNSLSPTLLCLHRYFVPNAQGALKKRLTRKMCILLSIPPVRFIMWRWQRCFQMQAETALRRQCVYNECIIGGKWVALTLIYWQKQLLHRNMMKLTWYETVHCMRLLLLHGVICLSITRKLLFVSQFHFTF